MTPQKNAPRMALAVLAAVLVAGGGLVSAAAANAASADYTQGVTALNAAQAQRTTSIGAPSAS